MCLSCGCRICDDDHGDDRHIDLGAIRKAAKAAKISESEVVANLLAALPDVAKGQQTSSIRFAFDIDNTITSDPDSYAAIARSLRAQGHEVYIVTGHGPIDLRKRLLDMMGFPYDVVETIDPGDDGQNKADYLAANNIAFIFENDEKWADAISKVATITLHYNAKPDQPTSDPPTTQPATRAHMVRLVGGAADGLSVQHRGLCNLLTVDGHDYAIDPADPGLARPWQPA